MRAVLASLVLLLALAQASYAQTAPPDPRVPLWLAQLQDPAWQNRMQTFYAVLNSTGPVSGSGEYWVGPATTKIVSVSPNLGAAFIALLGLENTFGLNLLNDLPEDFSDYWADVVIAVAALNDPTALDVLSAVAHTGSIATNAIASFGSLGLDRAKRLVRNEDPQVRISGMLTTLAIAKAATSRKELRLRAEAIAILLFGLFDRDPEVRITALYALGELRSKEARASILALLSRDLHTGADSEHAEAFAREREEAKRVLRRIDD